MLVCPCKDNTFADIPYFASSAQGTKTIGAMNKPAHIIHKAVALALLLLVSCDRGEEQRIREYNRTLARINSNLELINRKEGFIIATGSSAEGVYDAKGSRRIERAITENLRAIDSVMAVNRNELDALRQRLARGDRTIRELKKTVEGLGAALELKEKEILRLKQELERSHLSIAKLTDSLNTAFYIAAPEDSLKKWDVVRKKGGFLGIIGGVRQLDENISLQRFARLDKNRARRIPVPARKGDFRIVTTHNRDSYSVSENGPANTGKPSAGAPRLCYLVVDDPARFWAVSNLLVIELDD